MPLIPPKDDFGWEALSDEQLERLTGQRADSERAARQSSRELNAKMEGLSKTWVDPRIRLALNLFDLDRLTPELNALMLAGKLDVKPIVMDKNDPMETGLAFRCSLWEAACICDRLRVYDKEAGDKPFRLYIFRRIWSRLPANAVLTFVENEELVLNPSIFRVEMEPVEAVPLPPRKLNERKRT